MNNKDADQTARMRRLVCTFGVRNSPKTGFTVPRGSLQFVIVVFPDHTHYFFSFEIVVLFLQFVIVVFPDHTHYFFVVLFLQLATHISYICGDKFPPFHSVCLQRIVVCLRVYFTANIERILATVTYLCPDCVGQI